MLYGYPASKIVRGKHRKTSVASDAKLHRATTGYRAGSYYSYGGTETKALCGRTQITQGMWSFRAPEDWTPETRVDELKMAAEFFATGKTIPIWAWEAKPCEKCFPELTVKVKCSLGHKHPMLRKEARERGLVGGN